MVFAVNTGLIKHNALSGIRANFIIPTSVNYPTLKPKQLPQLMKALYRASIKHTTLNLILFQLHSMSRPSEAAGAKWAEIKNDCWVIPAERMKRNKKHIVPLTRQTRALLDDMKKSNPYSDYIFPSARSIKKPSSSSTANVALKRMGFKGLLVSHGLRSLASTTQNEQGFDAELIEVSLAHVDKNTVRSAYNRAEYIEKRRVMLQWWSDHIVDSTVKGLTS